MFEIKWFKDTLLKLGWEEERAEKYLQDLLDNHKINDYNTDYHLALSQPLSRTIPTMHFDYRVVDTRDDKGKLIQQLFIIRNGNDFYSVGVEKGGLYSYSNNQTKEEYLTKSKQVIIDYLLSLM